jgi:hypothetical protein
MPWQSTIALAIIVQVATTTAFAVRLRAGVASLSLWANTDIVTTAHVFLGRVVDSGIIAHAVALAVLSHLAAGPLGKARIERLFSARCIDELLRLLEPFD